MSGYATAIRDLLAGDPTLAALWPGGVHDAVEIDRQRTPGAFDANGELLACGLVKSAGQAASDLAHAGYQTIAVFAYHPHDPAAVEAALDRVYALLQRRKFDGGWEARWTNTVDGVEDEVLGTPMGQARYAVARYRGDPTAG